MQVFWNHISSKTTWADSWIKLLVVQKMNKSQTWPKHPSWHCLGIYILYQSSFLGQPWWLTCWALANVLLFYCFSGIWQDGTRRSNQRTTCLLHWSRLVWRCSLVWRPRCRRLLILSFFTCLVALVPLAKVFEIFWSRPGYLDCWKMLIQSLFMLTCKLFSSDLVS